MLTLTDNSSKDLEVTTPIMVIPAGPSLTIITSPPEDIKIIKTPNVESKNTFVSNQFA